MHYSFQGKKVLVTGAGRGIGKDLVKNLVKEGAVVYALSKNPTNLQALKEECPAIKTITCDLSDWNATENALADLEVLDYLVNNAAVAPRQLLKDAMEEMFDAAFNVNVKATINVTKIVTNKMIAAGKEGSIVNVSSVAAYIPFVGMTAYCASKAAVEMVTKCLSLELAPHKIRVTTINPTIIRTDMACELWNSEQLDSYKAMLPLNEFPSTQHCCNAIMYLLSDLAEYTTGTGLIVDSGHMLV